MGPNKNADDKSRVKILFLAPQPFFQERGTPIAVRLAVEVLARRRGDHVDLLTYPEGDDISVPRLSLIRSPKPPFVKGVGPGISFKKLLCDVLFFTTALSRAWAHRKTPYDLVHAVEESVFIAWLIKRLFGIPYIYDMDSSLALQLTEKWWLLKPLSPLLQLIERMAVSESLAVVPVCDALAAIAKRHGAPRTQVLRDISFLRHDSSGNVLPESPLVNLRSELGVPDQTPVILYIGNLERYQGIGLLLESFARVVLSHASARLAIIGGNEKHIRDYRQYCDSLGISAFVHFLGTRPLTSLNSYLPQATMLASPRTLGNNTPMKIYSYLHSGAPVVATRLPTHTQVLTDDVAVLAEATPEDFAEAMNCLLDNPTRAQEIGLNAKRLAEERYTFEQFEKTLNLIYDTARAQRPGAD